MTAPNDGGGDVRELAGRAIGTGGARACPRALRIVLALLALTTAAVAARGASGQAGGEFERRLQRAQAALAAGDAYEALLQVEAALTLDNSSVAAYVVHAGALEALGDALGARDSLARAAELQPERAELHWAVAVNSFSLADFPVALREGRHALEAGFEPDRVRRLFGALVDQGVPGVPAIDAILALPSVAVVERPPAGVARALRRAILDQPTVRLAPDPAAASCRLQWSDGPVSEQVGDEDTWRVRATTPGGRAQVFTLTLAAAPARAGAPAALRPRQLVQEVVRWLETAGPNAR